MRAGIDEVGRGPIAGPVVACALAFRPGAPETLIARLRDSKALTARQREALAAEIPAHAFIGLAAASRATIDRLDIRQATHLAMRQALARLERLCPVEHAIIDGHESPDPADPRLKPMIKADGQIPEVSAASIVAKVLRDHLMARLDARWPGYGWARNAGYPSPAHKAALLRLGPTPHHRRSFAPVRAALDAATG
jgi:ribonuclease HII